MQEQERETKLLKGMLLTFATLTYLKEFLQNIYKTHVLLFQVPTPTLCFSQAL